MPQSLLLILVAHNEPCNPVLHIVVETVVATAVAVVTAIYFRGGEDWRQEVPEYFVGVLFGGIT